MADAGDKPMESMQIGPNKMSTTCEGEFPPLPIAITS